MSRKIARLETLFYYDGPEVVIAFDQVNSGYICVLTNRTHEVEQYLCTPISPERSLSLRSGNIDLRTLFTTPEVLEFFRLEVQSDTPETLELSSIGAAEIPESWLPAEGFYLTGPLHDGAVISIEAQTRNRAIIELDLQPPEAASETKIRAANLGYAVSLFQTLVKYAYNKSISNLSGKARKFLDLQDNFDMEVVAFAPGSFKVKMQSRGAPDLTGYTEISRALLRLDEIMEPRQDLEEEKAVLKRNAGHLLKAFERFLKIAVDYDSAISYAWTIPESPEVHVRKLSRRQAEPIYNIINETHELGIERKVLKGKITRADSETGVWTLLDESDDKSYSGKCDPAAYVSLSGVTIREKDYELVCEEHLLEETVTGKEKFQLLLVSYKEL